LANEYLEFATAAKTMKVRDNEDDEEEEDEDDDVGMA
jgi:hypothetical protein